jgi:hypothetical protein
LEQVKGRAKAVISTVTGQRLKCFLFSFSLKKLTSIPFCALIARKASDYRKKNHKNGHFSSQIKESEQEPLSNRDEKNRQSDTFIALNDTPMMC